MKFGKKQLVLASLVLALGGSRVSQLAICRYQYPAGGGHFLRNKPIGCGAAGEQRLCGNCHGRFAVFHRNRHPRRHLAQARVDRQNSRDEALELLDNVLESVDF